MNAQLNLQSDAGGPTLTNEQISFFHDNGYLILKGVLSPADVAEFKQRVDAFWAQKSNLAELKIDCLDGPLCTPASNRYYFSEIDEAARQHSYKLNDAHLSDRVVARLSTHRRVIDAISDLLSATPLVCNSLIFERGSQQPAHFDTFYMPSKTPNMMCASWIAFDPVTGDNGPLFYYPKSHLLPPFLFSNGQIGWIDSESADATAHIDRVIADHGLEKVYFYPDPGDVLIWHAQLLHGGGAIADDSQTRMSLVTHYWTTLDFPNEGDWMPTPETGGLRLRRDHQAAHRMAARRAAESTVRSLQTPAEHLVDIPAGFDPERYLLKYPDVLEAGIDPYSHYHQYGRREGRTG